jgi:KUP system potassium uptake protein
MTTWKKGRMILSERLRARSYPFQNLLEDLQKSRPAKVPGAAIFMVGDADITPPTLMHNIKHNKVLHETIVFLTFVGEDVAFVSEEEKVQIKELAPGFFRVTAHYGFSETPEVLFILKKCEKLMPGFLITEPTFFLGREILVAGAGEELAFWRKILFSVMARNAESANIYFKIPLDRVIEVGMQIEL